MAAPAYIQRVVGDGAGSETTSATFATLTPGSTVLAFFTTAINTGDDIAVTLGGVSYDYRVCLEGGFYIYNDDVFVCIWENVAGGSSVELLATLAGSYPAFVAVEYDSGTYDVDAAAFSNSTGTPDSGTATATAAGTAVGFLLTIDFSPAAGTGWTSRTADTLWSGGQYRRIMDRAASASTGYNATGDATSHDEWYAGVVILSEAGGGGGGPTIKKLAAMGVG